MVLDVYELKLLLQDAAELAANTVAVKLSKGKDEVSQRQAYRLYGEANVRRWIATNQVTRIKIGEGNSKITYSNAELLAMQMAEKRAKILAKQ